MKRSLTGIKPTGQAHLGNYLGMVKEVVALQNDYESYLFIADYHALTTERDASVLRNNTFEMAASLLAFGIEADKTVIFRQSDVPETTELTWLLGCVSSMGDLTRAHAYKAAKEKNEEGRINWGLFSYPVLMAADIILYNADIVPVGKDQIQHVEMARAMAQRFNYLFGETLKEPQEKVKKEVATVPGTDGRKMSKSYGNGIEPLIAEKKLKKQIMSIVTDSKELEDVKDPENCAVVDLYRLFASEAQVREMEDKYRAGNYGYGHAKLALLEAVLNHFAPARERYVHFKNNPDEVEQILRTNAEKARKVARGVLDQAKIACGLLSK